MMMIKNSGKMANETGRAAERTARMYVQSIEGYRELSNSESRHLYRHVLGGGMACDWFRNSQATDACYVIRQKVARSIYDIEWRIDITIWNRVRWPRCLFIEIKSQTVGGSVDEKFPFVVHSLKQIGSPCGILMTGDGFRDGALEWVKHQEDAQLKVWRDAAKMRDFIEGKESKKYSAMKVVAHKQGSFL